MKPTVSMRQALADPKIFGEVLAGDSWATWRALLIAAMGEELTDPERAIFQEVTGRDREPLERVDELWAIVGRRGGKTRAIAILGCYLAGLSDWSALLAPGERATLPILSASMPQALKAFSYIRGIIEKSPVLSALVEGMTSDTIRLTTRVDVETRAASFRTVRGDTMVAAIGDEAAFWSGETSVNPDVEILNAVRPALLTTGGMLAIISSPYGRKGELWQTYRQHYGAGGDPQILVAQGASRRFNPGLSEKSIQRQFERDPVSAAAEYGGQFRSDIETFLGREAIEACTISGRLELPPQSRVRYIAFTDPSGGSADSFTLAIAHTEGQTAVLDLVREVRPPFSPDAVVAEFAATLKAYGLTRVMGDRYAGEWPRERFHVHGIRYEPSAKSKSDIYQELLPRINAGRVELLDLPRLANQLASLERRTARGGKDSIDHPPRAHDDLANAAAGAIVAVSARARRMPVITDEMINQVARGY